MSIDDDTRRSILLALEQLTESGKLHWNAQWGDDRIYTCRVVIPGPLSMELTFDVGVSSANVAVHAYGNIYIRLGVSESLRLACATQIASAESDLLRATLNALDALGDK